MKFSFELLVNTSPEKVWKLYADINEWDKWDSKLKNITLNGNFSVGSTGTIEVENQPPIPYKIVDVQENESFCTKTTIPSFGEIYFNHEVTEVCEKCMIKHTVELRNGSANEQSITFLKKLFSDVPTAVLSIKELMEN
ncbi:SRPBCC family protein [Schinkia azotoformans]|uniref:SRPBCC family protein n=1 Tax=Schinkia azotoformans TaxID=1454 RepID=UPI002DB920D1|nr:SRPBCC family protein [Schinkia azotoformans]MEC1717859.1 SRPBCC family protein [Schinkia azotoformans]MEC1739708.1 SRPBCC family protein [Schinkia azotoformans]MEC1747762.1 SRPBCC family protein [Schinkia azotoformans]MEC1757950.1 SRPBCC family protein [Schinkia azotoformans]MEC1767243.1 SRPBCC family protein [Schinkia azotoformans]